MRYAHCELVPIEDDYGSVCDLPYVDGLVAYPERNECYACGEVGLRYVGHIDGAVVLECLNCRAHSRALEAVKKGEGRCRLRSIFDHPLRDE